MKIAFTYYPAFVRYNHGVALLSSICKAAGLEVKIIPMDDNFFDLINNFKPDYVGASFVTVHDYKLSIPYIKRCEVPVLAGGVYLRKGGMVDVNLFKHVCRGEAENIAGFFIDGNTSVFDEVQQCADISVLPDYSGVTGYEFHRDMWFLKDKKIIPYSHSRGCPYKCTFCECRNLPKGIRIKETVKQDLMYLKETYNPELFFFLDELLPYYNYLWQYQFDGNDTRFFSYIRADITESDLKFLIDNGLYACAFGIESGCEEYRNKVLKKGVMDFEIDRTVNILNKNGIHYVSFFMTGTPGETAEIVKKTSDMASNIGNNIFWEYEDLGGARWVGQQQQ